MTPSSALELKWDLSRRILRHRGYRRRGLRSRMVTFLVRGRLGDMSAGGGSQLLLRHTGRLGKEWMYVLAL